jgi:NtrC-family two-component system sensor histidine kinase KinB
MLRDVTRLREVERLKSEFVMAASHELRTPLTSIGMSVDLLQEHAAAGLAEKDRELLATAHEEVERMKALINDLLDLAKIETGRILLDFGPVAVDELVGRVDANKITWVLTNLVSNALRHARHGGHIHVTAIPVGPQIHLAVQDDGPGIPHEYQARIFQKFVQVKGRESGGTGLGLAICKEIVRAHGGTIWVESKPGQGSTFTFTIPAAG